MKMKQQNDDGKTVDGREEEKMYRVTSPPNMTIVILKLDA